MFIAGYATWWGVVNQPDRMPEDRMVKPPEEDIGAITARETIVQEISEDGRVRWSLEGTDLSGRLTGDIAMKNPRAVIHAGDDLSIILTAPDGRYNSQESETILTGGVTAVHESDNSTFWAEGIRFSDKDQTITSLTGSIRMKRGNWELHAGGILIDLSTDDLTINLDQPVEMYQFE